MLNVLHSGFVFCFLMIIFGLGTFGKYITRSDDALYWHVISGNDICLIIGDLDYDQLVITKVDDFQVFQCTVTVFLFITNKQS